MGGRGVCGPPLSVPERVVRVEVDGEPRWGRREGESIVLDDGDRARRGRGALPRAGRADEDPRRPPHVPLAGRGVRGAHAARAVVLRQAADHAQRPPPARSGWRSGARFLNYEGELAVVVGRRMKGVPLDDVARPRRGLHVRERRRDARLPARRPRLDAPREGPGRVPPARAGARPGGGVRPDRLHAPHVPERARRAGDDRRRPAVRRRVPARRPVPDDHARARRRRPHRDAGQLAPDEARRRRRGRDRRPRPARRTRSRSGTSTSPGPGEQLQVSAQTLHVALAIPEDEAERMVLAEDHRDPPRRPPQGGCFRDSRVGEALLRISDLRARRLARPDPARPHRPRGAARSPTWTRPRRGGASSSALSSGARRRPRVPRVQRRAVLPRARRGRTSPATTTSPSSCTTTCSLDDARAHLEAAGRRGRGARRVALAARPRRPRDPAPAASARRASDDRAVAAARQAVDDRPPRRPAPARPCQLPHRRHPGERRLLHRGPRDEGLRLARRGGRLAPHRLRAPRDGARRDGRRALPPPRVRRRRHREDARPARPPRASRPLGLVGADAPRDRRQHRDRTCGSPRSRVTSSSTATWSGSPTTTCRASTRTTGTRRTPGGRCRRGRTSASTRSPSSSSARAGRRAAACCRRRGRQRDAEGLHRAAARRRAARRSCRTRRGTTSARSS